MKICKFIVVDEIRKTGQNGKVPTFSAFMSGQCIFELDEACPVIKPSEGCLGMAVPYEIHISQAGTIIFFTEVTGGMAKDRDFLDAMYDAWVLSTGQNPVAARGRTDRDTQRTGVDAATRMMMGSTRSAGEIARGRGERPSPARGGTLYDAIRGGTGYDPWGED